MKKYLGLGFSLLAACGTTATPPAKSSGTAATQSNRDFVLADGTHLDPSAIRAIGSLSIEVPETDADGQPTTLIEEFCTATLISPTIAITAKHCLQEAGVGYYADYYSLKFRVGDYDSSTPEESQVIASFVAPGDDGGWILGLDVGFVRLQTPITDVTPLPIANGVFSVDDVGRKFSIVGQGGGTDVRNAGDETLRATAGNYIQIIFGNENAWGDYLCNLYQVPVADCEAGGSDYQYLTDASYNAPTSLILEGRQAMFGGLPGEAIVEPGDSGGPSIGKQTNPDGTTSLVVYAVTTGYAFAASSGTFAALVGAEGAAQTLETASTWVDPCIGYDSNGTCSGAVTTRCSIPGVEGPRTLVSTDCSLLNLTCVQSTGGPVTCGTAGSTPPSPPPATSSPPAAMAQTGNAVVSTINTAGALPLPRKPQ